MKSNYSKTQSFIASCIGMSFFGVSMIIIGSILPSLTEKYSFSTIEASSIVAFLPIGILIGSLIFGPICDKYGHKILFLTSCIAVLIGILGLTLVHDLILLQLFIFIIGLGGGILNGETNAMVADLYDDKQRGSKLSLLGAFYGIGAIGIPLLTGLLSHYYDFTIIIRGIGAVMFLCIIYCFTISFPKPLAAQSFPVKQALGLLKKRGLLILSFILFFESGVEGSCNNWTALYLSKTTEIEPQLILQTLTGMVVALTLARLALYVILKKVKEQNVLLSGFTIALIGFGLLSFASNFALAITGMILVGVGVSATYPIILNMIGREYSTFVGTAFGVAMTISITGNILINNAVGMLSDKFSLALYPMIMMGCIILMIILYKSYSILLISKQKKSC